MTRRAAGSHRRNVGVCAVRHKTRSQGVRWVSCRDGQDPTPQRRRVRGVPRRSEPHCPLRQQPHARLFKRLEKVGLCQDEHDPTSSDSRLRDREEPLPQGTDGHRPKERWAPSLEADGRQPKDWLSGTLRGICLTQAGTSCCRRSTSDMLDFAYCMLGGSMVFFKFVLDGDVFILRVFVDGTLLVRYDRLLISCLS